MGLRQSNRPVQTGSHLEKRAGFNCIVMPQKKACILCAGLLTLLVEMNGIEPSTYALRTHRSPS